MAVFAAVVVAAFFLENNHLVAFYEAFGYFAYNFGSLYNGCADFYFAVIVGKKNAVELDCVAFFYILAQVVYIEKTVFLCLELLALDFYDYVHLKNLLIKLTR